MLGRTYFPEAVVQPIWSRPTISPWSDTIVSSMRTQRCRMSRARGISARARFGEHHVAARPFEEVEPEALLERADVHADGRLRDTEASGGLAEVLGLCSHSEDVEFDGVEHRRTLSPTGYGSSIMIYLWIELQSIGSFG